MDGALPAVQQGANEGVGTHRIAHRVAVGALTAVTAAAYSVFALLRFYTFQTNSYDLVLFDEAVRSYAHFRPGISIIKGVHNGFGPNFSILGDHWSPILASLAPLYWVFDTPKTLLVAQAVLFALAIPPLWLFTRRAFGGGRFGGAGSASRASASRASGGRATAAAYLVCGAYALSWPIASAVSFDFHEVAFAPVLIAVALERLAAGRLRTALIALAALLLVKEDMGFLVAGIGIYLAVARPRVVKRQLLVGIALVVVGLADSVLATYVLIPAFGGRSDYYWAYQALGNNVPQAAVHLITHPVSSLRLLITPRVKLDTMLWFLAAFCLLSLRSPIVLAAIPLLLERMLASKFPNWWVTSFQYNAYLVMIFAFAAVDGAARLDRWSVRVRRELAAGRSQTAGTQPPAADTTAAQPAAAVPASAPAVPAVPAIPASAPATGTAARAPVSAWPARLRHDRGVGTVALGCAVAMFAVAVYLVPRFAFGAALHSSFYHRDAQMKAAAAAVAAVPSGVTVQAVNNLGPQLSGRDTVLLWDGDGRHGPLRPPWVVADVARLAFTFASVTQQKQSVALLLRSGYRTVFERDGYVVLRRVSLHTVSQDSAGRRAGTASAKEATG
jgi:uncharacterized membrane protein